MKIKTLAKILGFLKRAVGIRISTSGRWNSLLTQLETYWRTGEGQIPKAFYPRKSWLDAKPVRYALALVFAYFIYLLISGAPAPDWVSRPMLNQRGMAGTPTRCSDSTVGQDCVAPILMADDMEDDAFSETLFAGGTWKGSFLDVRDISAYPPGAVAHSGTGVMRLFYKGKITITDPGDVTFAAAGPTITLNSGTWDVTPPAAARIFITNTVSNNTPSSQWCDTSTSTSTVINITSCTGQSIVNETDTTTTIHQTFTGPGFEIPNFDSTTTEVFLRWYERRSTNWTVDSPAVTSVKVIFIVPVSIAGNQQYLAPTHNFGSESPFEMSNQNGEDLAWNPNDTPTLLVNDRWYCLEIRALQQTTHTAADASFEVWVDGVRSHNQSGLDWGDGPEDAQPWGAMYITGQYNDPGPPVNMQRWIDDLVVSTQRVGCIGEAPGMPAGRLSTGTS